MAKDKLFGKPFDEGTLTKLELYRNYLKKWLPVFVANPSPFTRTINIFDFFAGMGCDSMGTMGSPMLAIVVIEEYSDWIIKNKMHVNLHLNDYDSKKIALLKNNINALNFDNSLVSINYYNVDATTLFGQLRPIMKNAANLVFFDQFGIKFMTKRLFQQVTQIGLTDLLFFVASNTFNRFSKDPNVTNIVGLDAGTIKQTKAKKIHDLVTNAYKKLIPVEQKYYLGSFSIQKGKSKNIYGLIFGSRHPLGMNKFLRVCWEQDGLAGAANYDIEDDQIKTLQYNLFGKQLTKIERFQKLLEEKILNGSLSTDKDIVAFRLDQGFIHEHVKPVIKKLKEKKKISYQGRLSHSIKILYKKELVPKKIKVL
jgi:three-Cys-motif partner protein